ncbi:dihydroxyacetone kinase [Natronococcus amylolyticus DSM 10524]|uniref:Dihydroxyacetone kinase n=1 Tax=Natronococcus amylolyticus DSM 10524 TaxID=1227497 RepID=L9X4S0_9EURY|nr:dihydroxyacetone kinase subunit DhaL [Natronococcus amylolyticus]ELY56784.1 dihydroxyacetone kinase [Natronococcus amylolyticus DSM 10524]
MDREAQAEAIREATAAMADRMAAEKSVLTDLDSAIGDADHGANMNRGFQAALERLEDADDDPATLVKTVGVALVSEVGGAAGPLYGGSLMKASGELEEGVTAESSVAFAERYLETVEERGKASVGDKTMVDAITPAVHTYKKSIEVDDCDPLEALGKAVDAAERGVAFTTPIRAKKGRASYLGWRSVGHQDPGATSTLYLLEELLEVAREHLDGDVETDAEADVDPEELAEPAAGGEVDESANSDGGS